MAAGVPASTMTRRDANRAIFQALSAAAGAEFLARWLRAADAHSANHNAPPDPHQWQTYQPKFFSAGQFQIVETFSAILIPTDDTPGAREAHVAAFIDFVVAAAAECAPEMQTAWRTAVDWLNDKRFTQLTPARQVQLVGEMADENHDGLATYQLIKEMSVRAFYTSRVGLVDVLQYQGLAYLTEFPACNHPEHKQV